MNVVDGMPQFVHRTFAEFFTARWFSRNFQYNTSVLERIFFDRTYLFMTVIFDRILARDCPLHCAVTDNDLKIFENLLKEGRDVNSLDKDGRNVMHIIAKHQSIIWYKINHNSENEVSLDLTESVLQWTPLHYAIKLGNGLLSSGYLKTMLTDLAWI